MKLQHASALLAAAVAATLIGATLTGCETVDESAPHARPAFNTEDKAAERAKQREEERKARELPTQGPEFPGQSSLPAGPSVITAADAVDTALDTPFNPVTSAPSTAPLVASAPPVPPLPPTYSTPAVSPTTWGTLPHLHTLPKDHYAVGSASVPGIAYAADFSTGQVLPLTNAPHRNWPTTVATGKAGRADYNPTYYSQLAESFPNLAFFSTPDTGFGSLTAPGAANAASVSSAPVANAAAGINNASVTSALTSTGNTLGTGLAAPQIGGVGTAGLNAVGFSTTSTGTAGSSIAGLGSNIVESGWFLAQTVVLPAKMIIQHPWSHVQSTVPINDPIYRGYLPETGPVTPTAYPGVISWRYPWTRDPAATLSAPNPTTTAPASTPDMDPKERP